MTRVLVVANRTASTPALMAEVERRAGTGARFGLLIPPEGGHHAPDWTREDAVRLLERAAGGPVESVDAGTDAVDTIHRAVADQSFDEILVSTVVEHHARWLHHDLPRRIEHLGVPVMVIPPEPQKWGPIDGFPTDWVPNATPGAVAGFGNY
jgi:predicted TIM-barrel fold metal-dependent hydrolase